MSIFRGFTQLGILVAVAVIAIMALWFLIGMGALSTKEGDPPRSERNEGTLMAIPPLAGEWLGVGDPSVIDGPGAPDAYATFSDIVPAHSNGGPVLVGVSLAASHDNGATWERVGSIAPARKISDDTLEMNEISSLVYDRADPAAPYKVLWLRFLNVNGNPDFIRSWVAMRSAATPEGVWSEPQKLIAGKAYDRDDPSHPDPRAPLFELPPEMQDCAILQEPGTLEAGDGFYMSINCVNPFKKEINRLSLLKFTHPVPGQLALEHVGTLFTMEDAARVRKAHRGRYPELKAMAELGASELFTAGGKTYLLASPVRETGEYMGCGLFEVEDVSAARVRRDADGTPLMLEYIAGIEGEHRGACSYAANLTSAGILMFRVTMLPGSEPPIRFETIATGIRVP